MTSSENGNTAAVAVSARPESQIQEPTEPRHEMGQSPRRHVRIEDLHAMTMIGDPQISPDGRRIAYVRKRIEPEKDEYISNIWLWEEGGNRQYTSGGKDSAPRWSPDGNMLAFLSARDDKPQIFVLNSTGGEARRLTDRKLGVGAPVWSPDSREIAFTAAVPFPQDSDEGTARDGTSKSGGDAKQSERAKTKVTERAFYKLDGIGFLQDRRNHLFVLDFDSGETRQLTSGDYHVADPAWSPDGAHIAVSSNMSDRWDVDIATDIWQIASQGGEPRKLTREAGIWRDPIYSPDGRSLACVGIPDRDDAPFALYGKLWTMTRTGENMRPVHEDEDIDVGNSVNSDWRVDGEQKPVWDERGIWFLASKAGATNVYRWQAGLRQETNGQHDVRDVSVAGDAVAFVRSDPLQPSELFLQRDGRIEQLTDANGDFLNSVELSKPERVTFAGADSDEIEGWMYKPVGFREGVAYPLILYIHGGPQTAYGWSFFHEMQLLAAEGYGVMLTNPHGSASYGEDFQNAIRGDWGNKDYQDIIAAAEFAASLPWVDAGRLGIAGGSYGGYMTGWVIGHDRRFAAAVVERAVTNFLSFYGTTDFPAWWPRIMLTTPEENATRLWEMSPIAHLANVKTSTLVIHSEQDNRCPVEQGEQFFTGLRRLGVKTKFVRFPEESHNLSRSGKPSRRRERLQHILDWFRDNL